MEQITHISTTETAKLVRAALKKAFPGVKFSVRSKSYSGGSSINVEYENGPAVGAVESVAKAFDGADFDGMQDLKTYHTTEFNGQMVQFGADWVHVNRTISDDLREKVARFLADKYGVEFKGLDSHPPIFEGRDCWGYYVWQYARDRHVDDFFKEAITA